MSDQNRISPHQNQYNFKHTRNENKEQDQLGDYYLIQYQILWTNITRITWQVVRRIANEISGVKGLKRWAVCYIMNPLLTKLVRPRWLDGFFPFFYTSTSSRSIKTQKKKKKKKKLRQYLSILTSRFINNAYLSIVLVLFFRYLTVYLN